MELFFTAILPDGAIQEEVTAFKRHCAAKYGAAHALKSPPHITLIPPHKWSADQVPALRQALETFAAGETDFEVQLNSFGAFPPRVLYVEVQENKALIDLHLRLLRHLEAALAFSDERSQRFHAHLTIAHRDLRRNQFPKAWAYFSGQVYRRHFCADHLSLLHHQQGRWQVAAEFPFGNRC